MPQTYTVIRRGNPIRNSEGKVVAYEKGSNEVKVTSDSKRRTTITGSGAVINRSERKVENGKLVIGPKSKNQILLEAEKSAVPTPSNAPAPIIPEEEQAQQSLARRSDLERGFRQTLASREDFARAEKYREEQREKDIKTRVVKPITISEKEARNIQIYTSSQAIKEEFILNPSLSSGIKSFGADLSVAGVKAIDIIEGRTKQAAGILQESNPFTATSKRKTLFGKGGQLEQNKLFQEGSYIVSRATPSLEEAKDNPLTALPITSAVAFELGATGKIIEGFSTPKISTSVTRSTANLRVSTVSTGATTTVGRGSVTVTDVVEQPLLRVSVPKSFGGAGTGELGRVSQNIPFRITGASSVRPNTAETQAITTDFSTDLFVNVGGKQRLLSRTSGVFVDDLGTQVTRNYNIKTGKLSNIIESKSVGRVSRVPNSDDLFVFRQTTTAGNQLTRSRFEEVAVKDVAGVRISEGKLVQSSFDIPSSRTYLGKGGSATVGGGSRPFSQADAFDTGAILTEDIGTIGFRAIPTPRGPTIPARTGFLNLGVLDESLVVIAPRAAISPRISLGFGTGVLGKSLTSDISVVGANNLGVSSLPSNLVTPNNFVEPVTFTQPINFADTFAISDVGIGSRSVPSSRSVNYPSFPTISYPSTPSEKGGGGGFPIPSINLGGGGSGPKYSFKGKRSKTLGGIPPSLIGSLYGIGKKTKRGVSYSGLEVRQ